LKERNDVTRIAKWSPLLIAAVLVACGKNNAPLPPDSSPPGRVTDLRVKSAVTNVITLHWKTPGDNGYAGIATAYQIRWSHNVITEENFAEATPISNPPVPVSPGTPEVFAVPNMDITVVLHFALRTFDEVGLISPVSNDAVWVPGSLPVQYYKNLPAMRDNTIYSESGNVSDGAGEYFFAGRTDTLSGGLTRRALLAFAVADSVPAGAQIDSVLLVLHVSKTLAGVRTVALHAATADWGEGLSDAPGNEESGVTATTSDATWAYRFFNTGTWIAPGGDFEPVASAQQSVDGFAAPGFYTWRSTQMNVDVQHWLERPDSNFGWVVLGSETASRTLKRFDSREHPTAAYHPNLKVYYTVIP
jgi:hypothetical protein